MYIHLLGDKTCYAEGRHLQKGFGHGQMGSDYRAQIEKA
jgi:hypothetical protein